MKATLTDANGVTYDLADVDVSRSLAEQRPDLAGVAMPAVVVLDAPPDGLTQSFVDIPPPWTVDRKRIHDPLRPPNEVTVPITLHVNAPWKVPNLVFTSPPIRGKNKRRRGRR